MTHQQNVETATILYQKAGHKPPPRPSYPTRQEEAEWQAAYKAHQAAAVEWHKQDQADRREQQLAARRQAEADKAADADRRRAEAQPLIERLGRLRGERELLSRTMHEARMAERVPGKIGAGHGPSVAEADLARPGAEEVGLARQINALLAEQPPAVERPHRI